MKDGFILKKEEIEKVVVFINLFNIKINIILFPTFDLHFFLLLTKFKKNIINYSLI